MWRGGHALREKFGMRTVQAVFVRKGTYWALGADVEEFEDGFRVVGGDRQLRGTVETAGDHRIAMAFGVLSALPGNRIRIDDQECAAVSYPEFWNVLRTLGGSS